MLNAMGKSLKSKAEIIKSIGATYVLKVVDKQL